MTPISIQCTTCQARLNIRKREALGKIFSCPSCGGMVLAAAPSSSELPLDDVSSKSTRWREPRPAVSASLLGSSYDVVNEILDQPPVSDDDVGEDVSSPPSLESAPVAEPSPVSAELPRQPLSGPAGLIVATLTGAILAFGAYWISAHPTTGRQREATLRHEQQTPHAGDAMQASVVAYKPGSGKSAGAETRDITATLNSPPPVMEREASLPALLQSISQSADLPITLDTDSLRYSRATLQTPLVPPVSQQRSLRAALTTILNPWKLECVSDEKQLIVRAVVSESGMRTAQHDISDLVANQASATEQVAALVRDFVRPASWRQNGGEGTIAVGENVLTITNSRRAHWDVLFFCESLRRARGLPVRSKLASSRSLKTSHEEVEQLLQSSVNITGQGPQRLTTVTAQLQKATGCQILINWSALLKERHSFDDRVLVSASQWRLHDIMARIVGQLRLTYRIVGKGVVEITTPAAERSLDVIEFYRLTVAQSADVASLISDLRGEPGLLPDGDQPGHRLAFDPVSRSLIVRLPASLQRNVVAWLRHETPKL